MAGFKTHISTSTLIGIGYGAVGHVAYNVPLPTAVLAGGLCSLAGILPDVDSDHGHALREVVSFSAAVIPMLLLERFRALGLSHETIVLAAALIYLLVRFGLTRFLQRYTVHRGMWHSIPAAATAGLVAALLCSCPNTRLLVFKASAVVTGYLWHLVLDEIYAIEWHRGRFRFKKSFGTALKMFSNNPWANISMYGKLLACVALVLVDPPMDGPKDHHGLQSVGEQTTQDPPPDQPPYDVRLAPINDPIYQPPGPYTADKSTQPHGPYPPISR